MDASWERIFALRNRESACDSSEWVHAESADRWRELLAGAGVRRASLSGRGLFKDGASDALVRQQFFDGSINSCQIAVPDFGTITGLFQIASLEFAGEHNGEVTFDIALESAGALSFAAA